MKIFWQFKTTLLQNAATYLLTSVSNFQVTDAFIYLQEVNKKTNR